jgi:hypothetical protein
MDHPSAISQFIGNRLSMQKVTTATRIRAVASVYSSPNACCRGAAIFFFSIRPPGTEKRYSSLTG